MESVTIDFKYHYGFTSGELIPHIILQIESSIKQDGLSVPSRNMYDINHKHGLVRIWYDSKLKKFKKPPAL